MSRTKVCSAFDMACVSYEQSVACCRAPSVNDVKKANVSRRRSGSQTSAGCNHTHAQRKIELPGQVSPASRIPQVLSGFGNPMARKRRAEPPKQAVAPASQNPLAPGGVVLSVKVCKPACADVSHPVFMPLVKQYPGTPGHAGSVQSQTHQAAQQQDSGQGTGHG